MRIVNTVHDSIIAEVPPDEEQDFRDIANRCFTVECFDYLNRVYGINFVSPLGASHKIGDHWSEGEEEVYNLDPLRRAA